MSKKKSRSLNIARKRAKRNQDQKSRRKQMAVKKQQWLQSDKSDEERFQEKILQTRLLLDEPELDSVTFDPDLMRQNMLDLLESSISSQAEEDKVDSNSESVLDLDEEAHETIGERFRQEVLPYLMTPEFIRRISHALKACETRLGRIGQRDKAEAALVARSLFELARPEELAFHPLVLKIGAQTLEQILIQPEFMSEDRDAVQNALSDVLSFSDDREEIEPEHEDVVAEFSESEADQTDEEDTESETQEIAKELHISLEETSSEESSEGAVAQADETVAQPVVPTQLPARALYKNFNGLETRMAIETWAGYQIVKNTDEQVEFVHPSLEHYITITSDRLLLQCTSDTHLDAAMTAVKERCGDALFYLARFVDES